MEDCSVPRLCHFTLIPVGAILVASLAGPVSARPTEANYDTPSIDRWVYPFNSTPGFRAVISTFSSLGQENAFPPFSFDQRDAQFLVGFDSAGQFPTGRGVCGYRVTAASLRVAVSEDQAFKYDPTYDDWTSYLGGAVDSDGRPIELYGAAYRNGLTATTYVEGSVSGVPAATPFGPSVSSDVRNVFASDYLGGTARDVSNNVRDGFNPKPFAVGQVAGLSAGQYVPVDSDVTFTLDVNDPDVQNYLRNAVNSGRVRLVISSLSPAASGGGGGPGSGEFPSFYAKEFTGADGLWARFSITVALSPAGDSDGSGVVDFDDITTTLANWGGSGAPGIEGDANCDGAVDFDDVTEILANWGATEV